MTSYTCTLAGNGNARAFYWQVPTSNAAKEAGQARIWAGIRFPLDVSAGLR